MQKSKKILALEILKNLTEKHQSVLDNILTDIDVSDQCFAELLSILDAETD
jgi:hypothetical protein